MKEKKQQAKAYEAYVKQFTPKLKLFLNGIKAFTVGGLICCVAFFLQNRLTGTMGLEEQEAKTWVTVLLICSAQLITGFGWFDSLAKFAGAGCIVPITGFANSVAAPAIEFKKEGWVLGGGCKIFTIAGPVILYGILSSWALGLIYWIGKIVGVV